jgi:hypothetical protein
VFFEQLHAGDTVLGADNNVWGVLAIEPAAPGGPKVTLVRFGQRVSAHLPPGTEVTVIDRADVSAEAAATGELLAAFGGVEIISERVEV